MATAERQGRAYWYCQLGGWGVYGALVLALYTVRDTPFLKMALHTVLYGSAGIGMTHLLRRRIHARGWTNLRLGALAWRVAASSALLGVLLVAVVMASSLWLFRFYPSAEVSWINVVFSWLNFSIVFLCWELIYFVVHVVERARRAEVERWQLTAAAQSAELRFLRGQMHPHFLFNCLNSLRSLISEDPARAQAMVTQLAGILRYSLSPETAGTVPLERELQVVKDYLALEAVRLEERLRVKLDISPESLAAPVPAMLVQTLVENAIKHGVARLPEGGEVSVSASVRESSLHLTVESPLAKGAAPLSAPEGSGIGLANARERLRLLFGERATLSLDPMEGDRATARVRIPLPA
ncbi:MAG TPA: histidine kinase [Myxococcaceae bacterium]|jgi:sensor histidine kinase YesM